MSSRLDMKRGGEGCGVVGWGQDGFCSCLRGWRREVWRGFRWAA